ncbi:histidine kinase N-terminal 7TM domain-containing diguanylate cyclase [Paenibacillus sabinae]|uniref:PAS/PAC sensor-containing diguanylate cyclase n=1 Tax=Paenibacillus sabinae T27 TaxID=1268072 RepID=X5A5E7_9BACL|nr:histidine kinase N-terminal 7TM domain-containing protein [Paenibacillus sabinae]AHV99503.1 PAS/PAC sensor-containing diguanylate cyclase [Paenibacillus sabinae T27]
MGSFISNYIVIVALSGVLSALLALFAYFKETDFAGVKAFIVSTCASAIYTFGFALELSSHSLAEINLWLKIEYLGMPFIAPASLIMVIHFLGMERLITRARLIVLGFIPCLTTVMVWTNDYHQLFYRSMYLRPLSPAPLVDFVMGPGYIVHGSFTFGCLLAAACLMLAQWNKMKRVYRRQFLTILLGLTLPTIGSFMYLIGKTPYGMDPVPVIMSLTSALYIWAILSRSMLTAAPIARSNLFESMRDGVLVMDLSDRLVDFNRAAAGMIQGLDAASIGHQLARIFLPGGKDAIAYAMEADPLVQEERELQWENGDSIYYYEIRSSLVRKRGGQVAGRMIVLIDVTERTLLQDRLRQLATMDSLTGICNRTYFMERSSELLERCLKEGGRLSIALFDVDHFKSINDRYGHGCGDSALRHIADICRGHLREGDVFGRYGGEEFVLCLPNTSLDEAARLADCIRRAIEAASLESPNGRINVTVSFGVTEAVPGSTLEALLTEADHALYASKRGGRNAVHLSAGSEMVRFQADPAACIGASADG